jgi:hypothetical protein
MTIEENFIGNVFALGFESSQVSKGQHYSSVKVSPDMFKNANVKGMELLLYFLLTRLDIKFKEVIQIVSL